MDRTRTRGRALRAIGAALLVAGTVTLTAPVVVGAGTGEATGTGSAGQTLVVTPAHDLDPSGETVTVTGSGFDAAAGFDIATEGMYLALCVDNGPGLQPTPCVGGIDMTGATSSARWISNNPYEGVGGVVPVAADGSFSTTLSLAVADEFTDCRALTGGKQCKVFTRMDHRAGGDRSAGSHGDDRAGHPGAGRDAGRHFPRRHGSADPARPGPRVRRRRDFHPQRGVRLPGRHRRR